MDFTRIENRERLVAGENGRDFEFSIHKGLSEHSHAYICILSLAIVAELSSDALAP